MPKSVQNRSNEEWINLLTNQDRAEYGTAIRELQHYLEKGLSGALKKNKYFNREEIEDFVQEATLKIIDKIDSYRGGARFTTWAMKIAVNYSISRLRKKQWRNISLDGLEYPEAVLSASKLIRKYESPERKTIKRETVELINNVISNELSEKQRRALTAAFYHGLPLTEIADSMGTNKNAVYKLIHDARLKLKECLKEKGFDIEEILDSV